MDNYPPGAANDPNAPYNQVDPEDTFGDKARGIIGDEMTEEGGDFYEWLNENGYLPDKYDVEPSTYKEIINLLSKDSRVFNDYYDYRKEDVINNIIEDYSNNALDPSDE